MSKPSLIENLDFYFEEIGGIKLKIFTEHYLLKRGFCCQNGCRHCPYSFNKKNKNNGANKS